MDPMKRYVVGFLFVNAWVLLLHKKRPAWQAGKLNGPGGKVEPDETFEHAMAREFGEEVGYPVVGWEHFATLRAVEDGAPYEVAFFRAERSRTDGVIQTIKYDEWPEWFQVNHLPDEVVPNLHFLIPMAYHAQREAWPYALVESHAVRLQVTPEWSKEMARREGDLDVGAGPRAPVDPSP